MIIGQPLRNVFVRQDDPDAFSIYAQGGSRG